jgi:hypothetical protein
MNGNPLSLGRFGLRGRDVVTEQTRRGRVLAVLVCAVAVWGAVPLAAAGAAGGGAVPRAVPAPGLWGTAIKVPGLGALNTGGDAAVAVSCASAGNCAAGGHYKDRHGHGQGFVAVERNGRWGTAIEVPGLGALNKDGDANVFSVSCAPAGNCAAGGIYFDRRRHYQGFVVNQTG